MLNTKFEMFRCRVPAQKSERWKIEPVSVNKVQATLSGLKGQVQTREGVFTRLARSGGWGVMMSDTHQEYYDHMPLWRNTEPRDRVLVHGLGLGCALNVLLANDCTVDVIELDPEIIQMVRPAYVDEIRRGRLIIEQGDAFTWKPPRGQTWEVVWHDIWADICVDNLPEMHRLHRRFGRRAKRWQGSWSRPQLERARGA